MDLKKPDMNVSHGLLVSRKCGNHNGIRLLFIFKFSLNAKRTVKE